MADASSARVEELVAAHAQRNREWRRRFQPMGFRNILDALFALGLRDSDLAQLLGTTERTARRWRTEPFSTKDRGEAHTPPPPAARSRAHDAQGIVNFLLADGTLDPEDVFFWLVARHPKLGLRRPLDLLAAGEFARVLEFADDFLGYPAAVAGERSDAPAPAETVAANSTHD